MKRFLSTKNTYTLIILWGLVLLLSFLFFVGINENEINLVPLILLGITIALIIWVLLDTRYVIKNNFLLYRSGPFRGKIDIKTITKIKKHSGLFVPVIAKPALDIKGFIITSKENDDYFVSPNNELTFLDELKKINPQIEVNLS